jgi:hypothetical protein
MWLKRKTSYYTRHTNKVLAYRRVILHVVEPYSKLYMYIFHNSPITHVFDVYTAYTRHLKFVQISSRIFTLYTKPRTAYIGYNIYTCICMYVYVGINHGERCTNQSNAKKKNYKKKKRLNCKRATRMLLHLY